MTPPPDAGRGNHEPALLAWGETGNGLSLAPDEQGQRNSADDALANVGVEGDVAAMRLGDATGDGEAQTAARAFVYGRKRVGARGVGAIEALEDAGKMLGGDARAVVADGEVRPLRAIALALRQRNPHTDAIRPI